jgi:hypothetical protein
MYFLREKIPQFAYKANMPSKDPTCIPWPEEKFMQKNRL